jgi:TolB-like protein/Tfp pilus assembly protein PilF/predicted Ser/Thr protein kinase
MVGTTLAHYHIEALLGSGGMGIVYRAFDIRLQRTVAIKLLQSVARDDSGRARLLKEARSASALNHPNICTIHEVGEIEGQAYIVMECVEGATLSRLIPPGEGLPLEQVLGYATQIADGLAHAHDRGVVHRDLKSANVVITSDGRVKILDFGVARRADDGRALDDTKTMTATAEVATAGTPLYMAPEVLRGEAADARSDIWAFGVTLYEMAAGERPFNARSVNELASAILRDPPAPLPPHVPPGLRAVIARCLTKDPERRYQRASELEAALDATSSGVAMPMPSRRHVRVTAAVVAAVAIVFAIAVMVTRLRLAATLPVDSIAVVPLLGTETDDETEYLADGITEGVINSLAEAGRTSLKVIALASAERYKRRGVDPREIGRELGVAKMALVRVARLPDALSISAELVDARDGSHIWGERYNSTTTNLLAVQSDITAKVAGNLKLKLTSAEQRRSTRRYTDDVQAYQLYLQGREASYRSAFGPEGYERSIQFSEQAIARDPSYALAYSGLASTYISMAYDGWIPPKEAYGKVTAAVEKGLAIDPDLGELHYALAEMKKGYEWDWQGSEVEYQRAIRLNPNVTQSRRYHALFLLTLHRTEEAIAEMKKTLELDPFGVETNKAMASTYYWTGRYDDAIAQARRTVEFDPEFAAAHQLLADLYAHKRMYTDAIESQKRVLTLAGEQDGAATLARDYAATGYSSALRNLYRGVLDGLTEANKEGWVSPVAFALVYTKLGDANRAFEWLEKAYAERAPWLVMLKADPDFEPLRGDRRFVTLATRIGLP